MSVKALYRWSGIVLLVGGLLSLAGSIVGAIAYPGNDYTPRQILSAPWTAAEVVLFIGLLLVALGYPACYVPQAGRAGRLGFAAFLLLWLGLLLGGLCFSSTRLTLWPYLAQFAPQLLPSGGTGPVAGGILWVFGPLIFMTLGSLFLGIATIRAGVYPKGAGTLLVLSAAVSIITLILPSTIGDLLEPVGDAALFLALAWFGLLLVAGRRETIADLTNPAAQVETAR